jgi:quercetin dioxygenase-like cupin family protein
MPEPQNINNIPKQQGSSDNFTGTVFVQPVSSAEEGPTLVARVTFQKGSHTVWHTHGGEQVLYFLEGHGRVQIDNQVIDATPGDIVKIPPHTRHWHGAHPDEENYMRHLAITTNGVTWLEPVPEEIYNA